MRRNKKGQIGIEGVFEILAYLFAAALLVFIIYFVYGQINSPVQTALSSATSDGDATFNFTRAGNQTQGGISMFNTLFPFLLLGLIISVCISAFFIGSHPVFFFVSLIILGVVVLLGTVFSNIFQQITTDTAFGSTSTNFSIINIFMKYLPFIMIVVIVLVMIVLWAKPSSTSGGQL